MTDIAAEVRDILVFHLGAEEAFLTDDARLAEDLGADRLDLVEIAMSCEERFDIDIPNHVATGLATVGDAVGFVEGPPAPPAGRGGGGGRLRRGPPRRAHGRGGTRRRGPPCRSRAPRPPVRRGVARLCQA